MLYKVRTFGERKKELQKLLATREELRKDVIEETGNVPDGQPTGKGMTGNPTEKKALRLIEVDRRIARLEEEIRILTEFEKNLQGIQKEVYIETCKKDCINLTAKAQQIGMGRRQLIEMRGKILRYLAQQLGEYLERE